MVFEAHGGAHDVGGPAEDFKRKEVVWAGLAEVTLGPHDPWGGNRPALVAAAVCQTTPEYVLGLPVAAPAQCPTPRRPLVSAGAVTSDGDNRVTVRKR